MSGRVMEFMWGVIFTMVMVLWMVFERQMGWHGESIDQHAVMTNFFAIPAILVYLFALFSKRKRYYAGSMTWKEGFVSGVFITLAVVILSPFAQIVIHYFITPDFFSTITEHAVNSGELTREAAEANFNLRNYIFQGAIGSFVMGLLTSAVVAVFTKSR